MTETRPHVSVVIPTHNRLLCLRQCLAALAVQTIGRDAFEVIVVADGCTDGTEEALNGAAQTFQLLVVSQPASGAAAARNRGAQRARGSLLLFLDDDVVATPGLVQAHVRAHAGRADQVAVGPYRLVPPDSGDLYGRILFDFWEHTFAAMTGDACPQDPRYVLSGNLSVTASIFRRIGGFNEAFPACGIEDYEFGLRMLAAQVPVVFAPDARARHLETTDVYRSFQRARHEGAAHVQLAVLYPEVRPTLRLSRIDWVSQALVFEARGLGRTLAIACGLALDATQRLRLRRLYGFLYAGLRHYWYCRGVADGAGDRGRLAALIRPD